MHTPGGTAIWGGWLALEYVAINCDYTISGRQLQVILSWLLLDFCEDAAALPVVLCTLLSSYGRSTFASESLPIVCCVPGISRCDSPWHPTHAHTFWAECGFSSSISNSRKNRWQCKWAAAGPWDPYAGSGIHTNHERSFNTADRSTSASNSR